MNPSLSATTIKVLSCDEECSHSPATKMYITIRGDNPSTCIYRSGSELQTHACRHLTSKIFLFLYYEIMYIIQNYFIINTSILTPGACEHFKTPLQKEKRTFSLID